MDGRAPFAANLSRKLWTRSRLGHAVDVCEVDRRLISRRDMRGDNKSRSCRLEFEAASCAERSSHDGVQRRAHAVVTRLLTGRGHRQGPITTEDSDRSDCARAARVRHRLRHPSFPPTASSAGPHVASMLRVSRRHLAPSRWPAAAHAHERASANHVPVGTGCPTTTRCIYRGPERRRRLLLLLLVVVAAVVASCRPARPSLGYTGRTAATGTVIRSSHTSQ